MGIVKLTYQDLDVDIDNLGVLNDLLGPDLLPMCIKIG
jgi:hypothetical protein